MGKNIHDNEIILITGGVKSGKSSWALKLGEEKEVDRAFIATAIAGDKEMEQKILLHQQERADRWMTFEEPREVADVLENKTTDFDVILIDCLTLWVSNLMTMYAMQREAILSEYKKLIEVLQKVPAKIIVVTNEVSMGIMPADDLSRDYQTLLGKINRDIAAVAKTVYFMVAGIPQKIK